MLTLATPGEAGSLGSNADLVIDTKTLKDKNNDGFVDGKDQYILFNDGNTLPLKDKKNKSKLASTPNWDAIKAIPSGNNFKVLVQGTNAKNKNKFYVWNVNNKGIIQRSSGWKTISQAHDLKWENLFGDVIQPDDIIGHPLTDSNNDGFVDGKDQYILFNDGNTLPLKDKKNKPKLASTPNWDAIKAIPSGNNFKVLVQGTNAKNKNKFYVWNVNNKGIIQRSSGWKTISQAHDLKWENLFGDVIQPDDIIGHPLTDSNNDGFVDGKDQYILFNDGNTLLLKDKKNKSKLASTPNWDAIKAIPSGNNFKVLVQGTNSKSKNKFYVWNVNNKGIIQRSSGWKTISQAPMTSNGKISLATSSNPMTSSAIH